MDNPDNVIKRLEKRKGVESVSIFTKDGLLIKTTGNGNDEDGFSNLCKSAIPLVQESLKQAMAKEELKLIELRTNKKDIYVGLDGGYIIITVCNREELSKEE